MSDQHCANCRFWRLGSRVLGGPNKWFIGDDGTGTCRRYAPNKLQPYTRPDDWCGEWEKLG